MAGVCDALHVPYISTLTKTEAGGGGAVGVGGGLVARIGPSSRHISMAVRDLVGDMSWRDVAVVVHRKSGNCDDDALARARARSRSLARPTFNESPLQFSHSFAAGRKSQVRIAPPSLPLSHSEWSE